MPNTEKRFVVAMSGGVDSSVAAWMLAREGLSVVGLFMRNGVHVEAEESSKKSCCSASDARDARMVAAHLGIPFQAVDLKEEFGEIIRYFLKEYGRGRTPNPCAVCNRDLKFNRLLRFARELGAEGVATGHYARLAIEGGRVKVRRGADPAKDQSYQLFGVAEENLARTRLPIGNLRKSQVRELAHHAGLKTAAKKDSQEICFVPGNDYRRLLDEHGVERHAGELVDTAGRKLGEHDGTENFTIGQRRGHGIGGGDPLFVVALEPEAGRVVLGAREECTVRSMRVADLLRGAAPLPLRSRRSDRVRRSRRRGGGRVRRAADGRDAGAGRGVLPRRAVARRRMDRFDAEVEGRERSRSAGRR